MHLQPSQWWYRETFNQLWFPNLISIVSVEYQNSLNTNGFLKNGKLRFFRLYFRKIEKLFQFFSKTKHRREKKCVRAKLFAFDRSTTLS